ncbi:hypothetical protein GQ43DRAFT_480981 [Delitschia confertaspora ATCC 74209]|uniref:Uncharacterized protein n=1 Tax=Delitschia confertaspora ATCC 74209 TaxID=1513339 RepID=A0A9P4JMU7_9PLEO|nr:hypothetical protein GQ43DRAFT_480981 [Delitschia confertaspora ATCC 74209]
MNQCRKKKSLQSMVSFTPAEFDALPHSVQRKYFSSLERLRITTGHSLPDQHHSNCSSSKLRRYSSSIRSHRRLRKSGSIRQTRSITQAEAQWFLSLPDKVRRRHFSREEQVLLASQAEEFLCNSSDNNSFQQRFKPVVDDLSGDVFQLGGADDQESFPSRGRSRHRFDSPRLFESNRASRSDSSRVYLVKMSSPEVQQRTVSSSRPRARRATTLSNIQFGRHSISSGPSISSPPRSAAGPLSWRPRASSQFVRRSMSLHAAPAIVPEATYYSDPEARKKLRAYLASPQKFDEAIEFGFPSTTIEDGSSRFQLPPIRTDAHNFSRDMHVFLKNDRLSFLDDNDSDEAVPDLDGESMTELESPITPSSAGVSVRHRVRHLTPSNFSSMDSAGLPPMHPMRYGLDREMTLRMTLTRPDLRTAEEEMYGWEGNRDSRDDPFALEELHLSDDMTGSKSPFAVKPPSHRRLVSRLFRKVRG